MSSSSQIPIAAIPSAPLLIDVRTGQTGSIEDWVAAFAALWRRGATSLDQFMSIFHADIRLVAPGFKPTRGHRDGLAAFRRTFRAMPDLTAEVSRWSTSGDALFVEMTFRATIGRRPITWHNVDRFIIRDGAVVERVAFFNPARVRRALLSSPRGLRQMLRLRTGL